MGIFTRYKLPSESKLGPSRKQSISRPGILASPQDGRPPDFLNSSGTRAKISVFTSLGGGI